MGEELCRGGGRAGGLFGGEREDRTTGPELLAVNSDVEDLLGAIGVEDEKGLTGGRDGRGGARAGLFARSSTYGGIRLRVVL